MNKEIAQANEFDTVVAVTNKILLGRASKPLSEAQILALKASWYGLSYTDVTKETPYDSPNFRINVAGGLWNKLTVATGERITKSNFSIVIRSLLEKNKTSIEKQSFEHIEFLTHKRNSSELIGFPPEITSFFGRDKEINEFIKLTKNNRIIVLNGLAGIGKTLFVSRLLTKLRTQKDFQLFIWKSINNDYTFPEIFINLILDLDQNQKEVLDFYKATDVLINELNKKPHFIVLDGVNNALKNNCNHENYNKCVILFERLLDELKSSTFVFTSRDPFYELREFEELDKSTVTRMLHGLSRDAAHKLLQHQGLAPEESWDRLISMYRANPLSLKLISRLIQQLYGGSVSAYLDEGTLWSSDFVQSALKEQIGSMRTTQSEKAILRYLSVYLADNIEKISYSDLKLAMNNKFTKSELIDSIKTLLDRSLLEKITHENDVYLSLQPEVKKYVRLDPDHFFKDAITV